MTDALAAVRRLTARRSRTEQEWRAAVRAAVAAGCSQRQVARVANVSHTLVQQIVRGE